MTLLSSLPGLNIFRRFKTKRNDPREPPTRSTDLESNSTQRYELNRLLPGKSPKEQRHVGLGLRLGLQGLVGSATIQPGKPWSYELQTLERRGTLAKLELGWDVVLTLLPLLFLAFAIVAGVLNGKPVSGWGDRVLDAAKLGPTIFPIMFAVIVRRMVREGARYYAQRGATLGVIDQLLGSMTIFGTVETQFLLRSRSVIGVALFTLWVLSPAGGQASLRLLAKRPHASVGTVNVTYLAKGQAMLSTFSTTPTWSRLGTDVPVLFHASLMAPDPVLYGPEDTWGNVRVPYLEKLDASKARADGWISVPTANVPYSSLLGHPVYPRFRDAEGAQSSNFTLETQYFKLECPTLQGITEATQLADPGIGLGFEGDYRLLATTPNSIVWQSRSLNGYTQAFCSLALANVEANVTCSSGGAIEAASGRGSCRVSEIRRSQRNDEAKIADPNFESFTLAFFLEKWNELSPSTGMGRGGTPTTRFLASGSAATTPSQNIPSLMMTDAPLHNLSTKVFEQRLTVCWNTLWQSGLAPHLYTRAAPVSSTPNRPPLSPDTPYINQTTATTVRFAPHYVCHQYWLALVAVSSSLLLISGIVGFVAKYTTCAPDILPFASSLTRDNPHIPLPTGGNTLDGMDRARALKHLRVRLQDVQPDAPVGRIALAPDGAATDGSGGVAAEGASTPAWQNLFKTTKTRTSMVGYLTKKRLYA